MPARWERDREIAGQLLQNACAYTWFGLAFIEGDIVIPNTYVGGIKDAYTIMIAYPQDFLHKLTPEGFNDHAPTFPHVSLLSHHDQWVQRIDGHIMPDWSLCLFVPGEAQINFKDFHSLKQLIELTATFLKYEKIYQRRVLGEKPGEKAKWPGPQREHGLPGYIQAIDDRGGIGDDDPCICGSGRRYRLCHKEELESARKAA